MQKDRVSTEDAGGSPIKAVIFDYGQVLVHSPTKEDFQSMADVLGVGFQSFYRLWETSRDAYDRGDVTAEEYWLKLAAQMGASIDRAQIEILRQIEVEIWAHPDQAMLVWLSALQSAGFKTALLSNMPLDLMTYVQENFQWMENFTFKTFSAEVRLIKPDPAIYEHTLRGLGVSAGEALFVDDREIISKLPASSASMGYCFDRSCSSKMTWKLWAFRYCRQSQAWLVRANTRPKESSFNSNFRF